jgi:3-phenylpropionate/trans-cinnamate dioxygenase ferredoxin reductase subunit
MNARILIVGAGQAAAQAVETLRRRGHTGPITLIGDEPLLPYQRPPLSKQYLAGALPADKLLIRHGPHYADHGVDLRLGFRAVSLDPVARRVEIAEGSAHEYDRLLLATGSLPRRLPTPGAELAGVHYLRTAADVDRLRAELQPGRRAVVIGAGYIGLEVGATCRDAGLDVTLIEGASRVMSRVASTVVSQFYEAEHARRGVKILCDARVAALLPRPPDATGQQRVGAVALADGREIPADFVLIAVGVVPADALAREAGLACDGGIVVDEHCRTSDESIWAAGDCTSQPSIHYSARVRLESVDNAFEQGTSAALNMLGIATVHDKVPWFWSDQFDLKMIIVGLARDADEAVLRGDPATGSFSVCHLKSGEFVAIEAVNQTRDQMAARKLIPARARPDRAKLADPAVPLRDCC